MTQSQPVKRNWSEMCLQRETLKQIEDKPIKIGGTLSQIQTNPEFTVNYNMPKDSIPPINVYPIMNVLNGLTPGTLMIINVNVHLH